jgi:hypothetical protein
MAAVNFSCILLISNSMVSRAISHSEVDEWTGDEC